ncbi:hypothetical protein [Streptomyces sp. H27-D2]|uniref:hypothetical protein n=1 Tax=Streptomyces sp. H27-D2 TaxID=3046304 RepID=UPI002DBD103B|nr:hypothetical protein [Streptomyces sp. H27-D2]MEC4016051.1 hypothetical protein [Streptomyces sp. H27-D2]
MADDDAPRWPDLTPVPHYAGLRVGDRINVLWTDYSDTVPAEVTRTVVFGALVMVDTTAAPSWSCDPFPMYVTQQCPNGCWAR